MKRYLSTLFVGAALMAPVALRADDDHHDRDRERKYYDSTNRDYHQWNDQENRAYRQYLESQHRQFREWNKASKRQQRDYWKWRHTHSDNDHDRDHR